LLKLSFGRSLRTLRLPLVLSVLMLVTSCGLSPLSLLTGGGPNVAAQALVGKEVTQGISIKTGAPTVSVRPNARVDAIDQSTTNNTTIDPWIIILLVLGWLLPSPNEMARWITGLFRRK
jgi:hypothetical protein